MSLSEDDTAYRKSVRNMALVLAAIVITVFAGLIIPPYFSPNQEQFQTSGSVASPFGFTLSVRLNSTHTSPDGFVKITAWVNNSAASVENITSGNYWIVDHGLLWGRPCTSGWPIGIGVMQGYYTEADYSQGALIRLPQPLTSCPVSRATPGYFLLEARGSKAVVSLNGTLEFWNLQSTLVLGPVSLGGSQWPAGTYTVLVTDEWGDVIISQFAA